MSPEGHSAAIRAAMQRPEVRAKLSERNPAMREDVRRKISRALTGRIMSDETKEKISIAQKQRWKKRKQGSSTSGR